MNGYMFLKYLHHFVEFVRPNAQSPCLLILDGHAPHTKNLAVLEFARANGTMMLSLPPHTKHRL